MESRTKWTLSASDDGKKRNTAIRGYSGCPTTGWNETHASAPTTRRSCAGVSERHSSFHSASSHVAPPGAAFFPFADDDDDEAFGIFTRKKTALTTSSPSSFVSLAFTLSRLLSHVLSLSLSSKHFSQGKLDHYKLTRKEYATR